MNRYEAKTYHVSDYYDQEYLKGLDKRSPEWVIKTLNTKAGKVQRESDRVLWVTYYRQSREIALKMKWLVDNGYRVFYSQQQATRNWS